MSKKVLVNRFEDVEDAKANIDHFFRLAAMLKLYGYGEPCDVFISKINGKFSNLIKFNNNDIEDFFIVKEFVPPKEISIDEIRDIVYSDGVAEFSYFDIETRRDYVFLNIHNAIFSNVKWPTGMEEFSASFSDENFKCIRKPKEFSARRFFSIEGVLDSVKTFNV